MLRLDPFERCGPADTQSGLHRLSVNRLVEGDFVNTICISAQAKLRRIHRSEQSRDWLRGQVVHYGVEGISVERSLFVGLLKVSSLRSRLHERGALVQAFCAPGFDFFTDGVALRLQRYVITQVSDHAGEGRGDVYRANKDVRKALVGNRLNAAQTVDAADRCYAMAEHFSGLLLRIPNWRTRCPHCNTQKQQAGSRGSAFHASP